MCKNCSSIHFLQSHHIYPKSLYPDKMYDLDNGITLCTDCHQDTHNWSRLSLAAKINKYPKEFNLDQTERDNYRNIANEERKARHKLWKKNNPEKNKMYFKKWIINNTERYKEISRRWKRNNPIRLKKLHKKYNSSPKGKARDKRFRAKNRERLNKKAHDKYYANKKSTAILLESLH